MKLLKASLTCATIFAAISFGGCNDRTVSDVSPNKSVTKNKEAKPGAAIKLISDPQVFINANEVRSLDLLLSSQETKGELNLEFSATHGLELLETSLKQTIHLDSHSLIEIPVKMKAVENGRYYLNIRATINNEDVISARNLALIVQVGEPSTASDGKPPQLKKPASENIIILPAQETISNQ